MVNGVPALVSLKQYVLPSSAVEEATMEYSRSTKLVELSFIADVCEEMSLTAPFEAKNVVFSSVIPPTAFKILVVLFPSVILAELYILKSSFVAPTSVHPVARSHEELAKRDSNLYCIDGVDVPPSLETSIRKRTGGNVGNDARLVSSVPLVFEVAVVSEPLSFLQW